MYLKNQNTSATSPRTNSKWISLAFSPLVSCSQLALAPEELLLSPWHLENGCPSGTDWKYTCRLTAAEYALWHIWSGRMGHMQELQMRLLWQLQSCFQQRCFSYIPWGLESKSRYRQPQLCQKPQHYFAQHPPHKTPHKKLTFCNICGKPGIISIGGPVGGTL